MPQPRIAEQPMTPWDRDTEHKQQPHETQYILTRISPSFTAIQFFKYFSYVSIIIFCECHICSLGVLK